MKNKIKIKRSSSILILIAAALITGIIFQACKKDESTGGTPVIRFVRSTDPAKSDSLITHAFLGSTIALVGSNLQDVVEIWFNDQSAILNTSFITDYSIIVTVPTVIPEDVTNEITLVTSSGTQVTFPFGVDVPPPSIQSMKCEYVADGDTAVIKGNFFIDDPNIPLQVFFPGNLEGLVLSVDLKEVAVVVPAGATVGKISMKSLYGSSRSSFIFRDDRVNVLNFDDLNSNGSWRPGLIVNDENSIDNNYLILRGVLDDNAGVEDYPNGGFVSELWSDKNGRPEGNFITGDPADYLLKFEANVKEWTGAYLNICFGPWYAGNDTIGPKNQVYWDDINARGYWRPWEVEELTSYTTDGWITVTMSMSEIKFNKNLGPMEFDPKSAGSMSLWMKGPSAVSGEQSKIEIYIDNVRIVQK